VIEVRAAGVHKGGYVSRHVDGADWLICIGDDRTDLDMYRALPQSAHTIHVGDSVAEARFTIPSPAHVRKLLGKLLDAARAHS
jgi:trehalose 6-phosphate synthase/phosphatase